MNHLVIDTIFNFINFAARLAIVFYLIKKYIAPKIANSIFYEKESLKILHQQHIELKDQCVEIEKMIENQEKLYFDLQKKFEIWQNSLVEEQQKYERDCRDYERKLAYQFEKKQYNLQRQMMLKQEFPTLIEQLEKDLHQKIKQDPQLYKKYMQNLVALVQGK